MPIAYNIHNRKEWPKWAKVWEREGDDMPCPACGKTEIETHEHITECLLCHWQDVNPVVILNDEAQA